MRYHKLLGVLLLPAAITAGPVNAGWFKDVFDVVKTEVGKAAKVGITVDVWNHSEQPAKVVMDNGREVHVIAAHAKATFGKANLGDMPTFHFHDVHTGYQLGSKKVKQTGNSTIEWRGV